ncbi:hypothetical protein [Streptomyces sp. NBC_01481]|uniref:hypothetical protein n=1 Tax=Streptomyces sp. NBC_01481 TaxID=2975869 RepID=UPI00225A555D|nr:hypothetical protein [Streptomyces sp. NBC_01481]MCX4581991.1 hypothetical protein [Streptomyces sp. NBC_01481]
MSDITRTRTAAATAATLLLALTACGASSEPKPATTTATVTAPAPVDKAQQIRLCMDAVATVKPNAAGDVPSEPKPDPCTALTESEYLDAYMDGIAQGNKAGQDELQRQIEEARESAQP